ncbi:hypothetical protein K450DRAFT_227905 [Umbelopsis ramanniana AG]|uniref:DDHD domain-containing protein n=1 Tax=Umbelopsis ramanniana AG TaxID=1314678 RepID=A0AAD5EE47_UMBRA|nr:uncharacterized protein K450DRAFT_227905 [Umbelopsis ramanniana AG]KAI8582208.1 hypothetical protein K450DRAFT_227905 [Umbelopsis ramanniana AG]
MFLETTYLESPSVSPVLPVEEELPPVQKEQNIEERYQDIPVNHLVFVIHGIGQQTEQYGHFYEHMEELRETTRQVLQAKVPDHNVRIELIPIEWHKHLHDQTDPDINKITLKSIPTIRLIENDYLADVLYYFSKSRGQYITDNVTNLFNTSYHNFMSKYPDFNGKIAIYGYSLGGIITWDILSHQRTPANDKEREDYAKLDIVYPKLDFKPDYFFALGSPVGAILVFRNQNPLLYRPDDSIIFENIFHPFDPLAYRFEPLLSEKYTDEAAVLIERSIPIGPNFSLPSLPSFPGSSLLSMFSRFSFSSTGESVDPAQSTKQLLEASDEAVTQNHQTTGYWKWITEYFGGQHSHEDSNKQSRDVDGSNGEVNGEEEDNNGSSARAHHGDLTTFDGFEGGPRVIDCTDNDEDVFDEEASTKWAGGVLSGKYDFTGPLKPRRMGSRFNKNGILTSGVVTAAVIPEKNDYFSIPKSSESTQHTVDVLGNDGMRVDSLRWAKSAHKSSQHILNQLSQDFDSPLSPTAQQEFLSNMRKGPNVTINDDTSSVKSHDGAKSEISRNSNNIMDDLSKELHEPGAKIMEPRQSSESITKDATVPQEGDHHKHSEDESEDLPRRMDFVLQPESFMDMLTNEYIVGFRAHFSYWTNKDLQWHILRRLEILDEAEEKDNE